MDYVVVPLVTGPLKVVDKFGTVSAGQMTAGESYSRSAGVEHDIVNDNAFDIVFVEVEYK